MDVLRTPEERFRDLPEFPYEPRYVEVDDGEGGTLRVAYVDEGSRDSETVLLLHGEPSWSYLYRSSVPVLVQAGLRAVAPDLVGFDRPFLTAFSDADPITRGDAAFQKLVPGAAGREHLTLSGGHFLQEDVGPRLAQAVVDLVAATPGARAR